MFVTFLTDFGLADDFVGVCHGVIKRIAPETQIVDVTHGIEAHNVLQGALVLANTLQYVPSGIHLAVVDPGVGTGRRALALRSGDGRFFVGPDNGLLLPAAESAGGVATVNELTNPEYMMEPVSRTFHARDVFAPAAAHLSRGLAPAELGPPLDPDVLIRLDLPEPTVQPGLIVATVLSVDRFGNVQLNLAREHLEAVGLEPGLHVELELAAGSRSALVARTFGDAAAGDLVLYQDSYLSISLAVNGGDAARELGLRVGQEITVRIGS